MKVGDRVRKRLSGTLCEGKSQHSQMTVTGTVIWIHPRKRFYVAEFRLGNETVRECFEIKE